MGVPDHTDSLRPAGRSVARWRAYAAAAVVLVVFVAVVVGLSVDLRERLRREVLNRERELLQSVTAMQSELVSETFVDLGLPVDTALEIALNTSKPFGVLGVRIYDESGEFWDSVPLEVNEGFLEPEDLANLTSGQAIARFHADFDLGKVFLQVGGTARSPMLEVMVPMPASGALGENLSAQYWINGLPLQAEFARIDEHVFRQAGFALLMGVSFIAGSLYWAMRSLARANKLLRRRAEDLARANRELGQAARTSAIGSITAHLMHGLRNPLAGLEGFVSSPREDTGAPDDSEWTAARESTRRLRSMVNEVQMVLSDVDSGADFELSAGEVCAGLHERIESLAQKHNVRLEVTGDIDPMIHARVAGLGGFVLANLVHNAIEVTPAGASVKVVIQATGKHVGFSVIDCGPGLPPEVARDPFCPRRSSKPDGAGIGLAISRELARHAGGELELVRSDSSGVEFRLRLPVAVPSKTKGIT